MSLERLPYEVTFLILKDMRKYYKCIETLKAMRLTSRSLNLDVTGALFECLYLLAHSPESWTKMKNVQQHCRLAENVKYLVVYGDCYLQSDIHDSLDLTSIPNPKEIELRMTSGASILHFKRRRPAENAEYAEHDITLSLDQFCNKENRWVDFVSDLAKKGALVYSFELELLIIDQG